MHMKKKEVAEATLNQQSGYNSRITRYEPSAK